MNLDYYFSLYMYMLFCMMFCFYYKHMLLIIISLEFISIIMIFNFYLIMMYIDSGMHLIIFMLTMSVCEGALSLSLIVMMVRFYGNDYINSLSFLKW